MSTYCEFQIAFKVLLNIRRESVIAAGASKVVRM